MKGACHLLEGNPLILLEVDFTIFGFRRVVFSLFIILPMRFILGKAERITGRLD